LNVLGVWEKFIESEINWTDKKEICIGTNDSWGNWKVYTNKVKCPNCGEYRLINPEDCEMITK
jgi:predicted RNA-binding Zn-ribbon protein involved in translation (DUF1610 family)